MKGLLITIKSIHNFSLFTLKTTHNSSLKRLEFVLIPLFAYFIITTTKVATAPQTLLHFNFCLLPKVLPFACLFLFPKNDKRFRGLHFAPPSSYHSATPIFLKKIFDFAWGRALPGTQKSKITYREED